MKLPTHTYPHKPCYLQSLGWLMIYDDIHDIELSYWHQTTKIHTQVLIDKIKGSIWQKPRIIGLIFHRQY